MPIRESNTNKDSFQLSLSHCTFLYECNLKFSFVMLHMSWNEMSAYKLKYGFEGKKKSFQRRILNAWKIRSLWFPYSSPLICLENTHSLPLRTTTITIANDHIRVRGTQNVYEAVPIWVCFASLSHSAHTFNMPWTFRWNYRRLRIYCVLNILEGKVHGRRPDIAEGYRRFFESKSLLLPRDTISKLLSTSWSNAVIMGTGKILVGTRP